MSHPTPPELLVLHAVRTLGYADGSRIAERVGLALPVVEEHLEDARARGWTTLSSFAGDTGWSLTEAGKAHGERLLAAELAAAGARDVVEQVHAEFLPLNDVVAGACTAWQLAELGVGGGDVTLAGTVATLAAVATDLGALEERLTTHLSRFAGYHRRFAHAVAAARTQPEWVTGTDRDSCHRVWFELHEDLIATLGLTR